MGLSEAKDEIRLRRCVTPESVACLDLDYDPGGSLSWTTTQTGSGPSLSGGGGSFTTAPDCIKLVINFAATIEVQGSGQIVSGYGGVNVMWSAGHTYEFFSGPVTEGLYDDRLALWYDGTLSSYNNGYVTGQLSTVDFSKFHKSASWNQTSEVRYDWAVIDQSSNQVVKWARFGSDMALLL